MLCSIPDNLRSIVLRAWVAASLLLAPALWAAEPVQAAASSADALEASMAGEFALQAGQLDDAARWYLEAARKANGDDGLAARATRIALLTNDETLADDALALWRQRAPRSLPMHAAEATLALRRDEAGQARRILIALMRRPGVVTDDSDVDSADADATDRHDASEPGSGEDNRAEGSLVESNLAEDDQVTPGWRYVLGVLGSGSKNPTLAAQLLGEIVDADVIPDQLQAWLMFGGLAQRLDQPELAERIVAKVVERFPDEPRVALLRVSQLREAGKKDEALAVLAKLEKVAQEQQDLRLAIASQYHALDEPAAAAAILAQGPQDDYSYRMRAALLAEAEDQTSLLELYRELERGSAKPDPQRRLLLGQVAEFLERFDDALRWYRSVPGGPQRWQARLRSANVLHELDRDTEAYAQLHALQNDAQASEDARRDAYLLEAELRHENGDAAGEIDTFARGLAAYPNDAALLYSRALAWERRDDIARAEADFRKILVAEPDNVAALNALGYTLADRTTRYKEALELIDRARVAEPDNAAIIDSHGWVLYRLGRLDEALVELRRAFSLQEDAEIAAHLAEVLWVLDKRDEARKYFEKAREIDPDNRALKRALDKTGA